MPTRRLYFDNAATCSPKPAAVVQAVTQYLTGLSVSPNRGGYVESVEAGQKITECRRLIGELIGGAASEQIIFTANGSESLNLAFKGLINPASEPQHVICTDLDHNSVFRPLYAMRDRGWLEMTRIPASPTTGRIDPDDIRRAIRGETVFITMTHVSNVIGTVQPLQDVGRIARSAGIPFIVDAAQSAGHVPIDVEADGIDLLAAPGHKFLMGPLGTGFLYIRPGLECKLRPLKEGGTGSFSELDRQPDFMPSKYEAGSLNAPGIIGLLEGVRWVAKRTIPDLRAHDSHLVEIFLDALKGCRGITLYGPGNTDGRIGVFSVRIEGFEPQELSAILESHYGVLTRSGLHCAPHTHQLLGTAPLGGTTRLSFGPFLTEVDVQFAAHAMRKIAGD